jgi:hypothetical protein
MFSRVIPGIRSDDDPNLPFTAHLRQAAIEQGRRLLFIAGFTRAMEPQYRLRPHWMLMWAGVAVFVVMAIRSRRLEFWQAVVITYLAVYLGSLVTLRLEVQNYGFRMIVPALPCVLLLAVKGADLVSAACLPLRLARPLGHRPA